MSRLLYFLFHTDANAGAELKCGIIGFYFCNNVMAVLCLLSSFSLISSNENMEVDPSVCEHFLKKTFLKAQAKH